MIPPIISSTKTFALDSSEDQLADDTPEATVEVAEKVSSNKLVQLSHPVRLDSTRLILQSQTLSQGEFCLVSKDIIQAEDEDCSAKTDPASINLVGNTEVKSSTTIQCVTPSTELAEGATLQIKTKEQIIPELSGRSETSNTGIEPVATDALAVSVVHTVKVQSTDIEALFHSSSYQNHFSGTQLVVDVVENVTLLLKNGWAYVGLNESPLELPLEPPAEQSENWAPWRAAPAGGYEFCDVLTGEWTPVTGNAVNTAPAPLSRLAGQYKASTTLAWGNTTFTGWSGMTLTADGQFMITDHSLVSSSGTGRDTDSITVYTSRDAQGKESVFSGTHQSTGQTGGVAVSHNKSLQESAGDRYGSYSLLDDGVTLQMEYANGQIRRQLFVRLEDRAVLNNKSYVFDVDESCQIDIQALLESQLYTRKGYMNSEWLERLTKNYKKASLDKAKGSGQSSEN